MTTDYEPHGLELPDGAIIKAAPAAPVSRIKVKTIVLDDGLTITADPEALDDWEFMELLEADQFAGAMKKLLTEAQLSKLKEHYRDPISGRVKMSVMAEALKTIMEKLAPNS